MYKLKLGINVEMFDVFDLRKDFYKEVKEIKKVGFDSVDFTLVGVGGYKNSIEKALGFIPDGLKAIQDEGLELNSVHLPFYRFCYISSYDEAVRRFAVKEFKQIIEVCDEFKPKNYVFHSGLSDPAVEGIDKLRRPALIKSFQELAGATESAVCLENLPRECDSPKEVIRTVDQVPKGKLCLDVNHVFWGTAEDAALEMGHRISALHISDHDYKQELHVLPKEGKIDWMKVLGALEKIGYNGVFSYELWKAKYGYTYEQIIRNYEELFEEYNK